MRLIDAVSVVNEIMTERDKISQIDISSKPYKHGNSMRAGIRKALRCIEQAPTIDAVPVVRCKDCVLTGKCLVEEMFQLAGIDDQFCCVGKRKEGDGNES